ncbi:oligopeptide ABC transporter substrate-binding protein [Sporosarcina siberiensis]|uniref:Oligopeptide ABC transporter substrate-binding protein n=1 Tax=Sporosarcina siberiensis TaxID=1365606 RepID=A0ABW4SLZ3_9BACL
MAKKQLMLLASLMLILSLFLAACTGKEKVDEKEPAKTDDKDKDTEVEEEEEEPAEEEAVGVDFPLDTTNSEAAIEDGEMIYALVSSDPFEGTLNKVFYSGAPDAEVMQFFDEDLLAVDGDYLITSDGAASFELSEDNKTITLSIKDGVNWHDGEPVKASDLLYAYELLGHPDYTGNRYTFTISNVEGMPAYHDGTADTISGIVVSEDEKTISITYDVATPSVMSGIWSAPVPRHYVGDVTTGDVTIDDILASNTIRTEPIGFGPYKVSKIVPGESVLYERYDEYWRGKPGLKSVVLKVVAPGSVVGALEKGEIDLASVPVDQYNVLKEVQNIELLGQVDTAYTYIGFKLGKWDAEKKVNVMDPNALLADKRVRQAMWHAMDNEVIGEKMYHGLRFPATTLIIPVFDSFHDADNPGRPYDPEKAKALLDEAGWVDVDGDGIRENAEGEPVVLNFASMEGGDVAEPIANWYIQNWEDVGIKVQLYEGRLHEFNAFYDLIETDEPGIDIYQGAWGTGTDPDPEGLYGDTASYNYTRFVSEKNSELLAAGTSEDAFDADYRKGIYNEWQELMVEEVPVAPTVYRYELFGVNKRLVNYTIDAANLDNKYPWKWGVSQADPVK